MYIPIFYWIETVNQELLHAVYTLGLPIDEAARLKNNMLKKRKINMIILLCGAGLFLFGMVLPVILFNVFDNSPLIRSYMNNTSIMIGSLIAGFVGLFAAIFSANKCFGVAGSYLKALRIAYPNLPSGISVSYSGDYEYNSDYVYNPEEYKANKRNNDLLMDLSLGKISESRAHGLLHYAISGSSLIFKTCIFAFVLAIVLFLARTIIVKYNISILDGSADKQIIFGLQVMWIVLLLSGIRSIYVYRTCQAYIEAINSGYRSLINK
jgi:hypothetical protein